MQFRTLSADNAMSDIALSAGNAMSDIALSAGNAMSDIALSAGNVRQLVFKVRQLCLYETTAGGGNTCNNSND